MRSGLYVPIHRLFKGLGFGVEVFGFRVAGLGLGFWDFRSRAVKIVCLWVHRFVHRCPRQKT